MLSRRGSFLACVLVLIVALWTASSPSLVYPIYTAQWQLSTFSTTAIFTIYYLIVVVMLMLFGDISDYIGRRAAILIGIAAMAAGDAAFLVAPDLGWVLVARCLQGVGVGLALSPAAAALVDYSKGGNIRRASAASTAATSLGAALAVIVGGALVQYAPWPLHLGFLVLLVLTVLVGVLAWLMPRTSDFTASGSWSVRRAVILPEMRRPLVLGAIAVSVAYVVGSTLFAIGAQVAQDLIRTDNALLSGSILSLLAVLNLPALLFARGWSPRWTITLGGTIMAAGLALFLLATATSSLVLFVSSTALCGLGWGLTYLGAVTVVNLSAPITHRAGALALMFGIGYGVQIVTVLGVGATATSLGLSAAVFIWIPVIIGLALASAAMAMLLTRPGTSPGTAHEPA